MHHNEKFEIIAAGMERMEGVTRRKMFGWDCLWVNGNSFMGGSAEGMLFKLTPEGVETAIRQRGVQRFDPMGSGKGMTGWVIADMDSEQVWPRLAQEAFMEAMLLPPRKQATKKAAKKKAVKKATKKKIK